VRPCDGPVDSRDSSNPAKLRRVLLRHDGFRRLCRARDLLLEARDAPLSISDLAREVQISPFHLIRQFEAVFGETPNQFRQSSRIELARHLLATGQRSVTDVCMEVGFSSLGSFSVLFTRRVGETPSAYRRRMRPMVVVPGAIPEILVPGCLTLMARTSCVAIMEKHATPRSATLVARRINAHQVDEHHGR